MGCGSGKNNPAVSHFLPLFVCAGAACHFPTEITHSALVYLINTLSFMNSHPAEGGRGLAGVNLGVPSNLVKWSGLWEWSMRRGRARIGSLPCWQRLAALWCFCSGISLHLESRCGGLVWLGIDAPVLNASPFLFVPVSRGSVWPVACSAIPKHPAQGSRQRYRQSENIFLG